MKTLASYTGTNVSLADIVNAASAVQLEYRNQGRTNASVSIASEAITNGLVTLHVFRAGVPLILVSGKRYSSSPPVSAAVAAANAPALPKTPPKTPPPATVRAHENTGDTLLSTEALMGVLAKHTGTNLTMTNIVQAASELQMEYRNRGFPTVKVSLPPQRITNGIVKIQVFEGRLSGIEVTHNRYFSSNNVMRALPSLRTNTILVGPILQAELDRANANPDRQIWPQIEPGPVEGTSLLDLTVKDRLPLHGKIELNDQNSPGTPDLRLNTSAAYQNLWQLEHSLGVQYSFSPEQYKQGTQWGPFDQPMVANYSAFYRLPLGGPEPVSQAVANQPGNFGYDEASRQFRLPPPSGRPELNFYASRSTIDTGVMVLSDRAITDVPGVVSVFEKDVQQDLTVNQSAGFRLSQPLTSLKTFNSSISGGLDYKAYELNSVKTNNFIFTVIVHNQFNIPVATNVTTDASGVQTHKSLDYLPLSLRYDASLRDPLGTTFFGLGLSVNPWYAGPSTNVQWITGSKQSSGNWVTLNPGLTRDLNWRTNWTLSVHADGQWASEPLIANEQFGLGGVAGVRGYHEGEVFGDTGWRFTVDQKTPPCLVGTVYPNHPLIMRGTVYMDYGEVYLLDPQGRQDRIPLWGTGFGAVFSVGGTWEARFLSSWPLLTAGTTEAFQPRFNFNLSAQF